MSDVLALLVSLALSFAAAGVGGLATARGLRGWYGTLAKPRWTPPSWVFAPAWTVLYAAMAVAAWLVWRERGAAEVAIPLAWYALQLALNVAWSVVFFGLRSPMAGLAVIVLLWWAIAGTIAAFAPVSPLGALVLLPYLAWVTFATALNAAIAAANRRGA
ncbi:MAG TPA: TspO/MBR family protein [Candidatus Limnocylindria bacterium]|nr:TspO/MBR family protein [Candidatus Limnocylindria bacterium]